MNAHRKCHRHDGGDKTPFASFDAAFDECARLISERKRMHPYFCADHNAWHIGTNQPLTMKGAHAV